MNKEMRDLLARASVVSEAPAQNMDSEPTSHSKAGATAPRGQGDSLYDRMTRRFESCHTELDERRAVAWAAHELTRALRSPSVEFSAPQRHYWVIVASQGRDYRDVALENGIPDKQVWKMRSDAGYEPRKGFPKAKKAA